MLGGDHFTMCKCVRSALYTLNLHKSYVNYLSKAGKIENAKKIER